MSIIELLLLAIGLSMDAFAVSISDGLAMKKIEKKKAFLIAGFFGFFQGAMPLIGYFLGSAFSQIISQWDHYIALIFLGFIGGKMIVDGVKELRLGEKEKEQSSLSIGSLFVQAIATSIDALIVGVSFAAMSVDIVPAVSFIAVITFGISLVGVFAGKKFGELLGSKAEIIGGIILCLIGLKVFIEHMFFGG